MDKENLEFRNIRTLVDIIDSEYVIRFNISFEEIVNSFDKWGEPSMKFIEHSFNFNDSHKSTLIELLKLGIKTIEENKENK